MSRVSRGHDRILRTAADLFARHGYDGVSIADIARAARVCKATVFHHFPKKSDLYRTILIGAAADFRARIGPTLALEAGVKPGLAHFAQAHYEGIAKRASTARLVMRELAEGPRRFRELLRTGQFGGNFGLIVSRLEAAQNAGRLRSDVDCRVLALVLLATSAIPVQFAGVLDDEFKSDYLAEPDRFAAAVADLLAYGVTTPDADKETQSA